MTDDIDPLTPELRAEVEWLRNVLFATTDPRSEALRRQAYTAIEQLAVRVMESERAKR